MANANSQSGMTLDFFMISPEKTAEMSDINTESQVSDQVNDSSYALSTELSQMIAAQPEI